MFQPGIEKWDNWRENGKYLISYDDSEFTSDKTTAERRTIEKALHTLESVTSLKFVKFDRYTCPPDDGSGPDPHPCNWYMKFQRSKNGVYSEPFDCRVSAAWVLKLT